VTGTLMEIKLSIKKYNNGESFPEIKNKHATTNERRRTSNGTPLKLEKAFMKDLLEAIRNQNLQPQPSLLY
jgi:hypothetical protein